MKYPKPLLKRLVLTSLVGTGILFTGLIFYYYQADRTFLFLSLLLFAFSLIKNLSLYHRMKKGSYHMLEGICTEIRPAFFRQSNYITILSLDEQEHCLLLTRSCKLCSGSSYRLYFKAEMSINSMPTLFTKAVSTDNFLGMELIT